MVSADMNASVPSAYMGLMTLRMITGSARRNVSSRARSFSRSLRMATLNAGGVVNQSLFISAANASYCANVVSMKSYEGFSSR